MDTLVMRGICTCTCTQTCTCTCKCTCAAICTHTCTHMHKHMHTYMHMHMHMHKHTHTHMHMCTYMHTHAHTPLHWGAHIASQCCARNQLVVESPRPSWCLSVGVQNWGMMKSVAFFVAFFFVLFYRRINCAGSTNKAVTSRSEEFIDLCFVCSDVVLLCAPVYLYTAPLLRRVPLRYSAPCTVDAMLQCHLHSRCYTAVPLAQHNNLRMSTTNKNTCATRAEVAARSSRHDMAAPQPHPPLLSGAVGATSYWQMVLDGFMARQENDSALPPAPTLPATAMPCSHMRTPTDQPRQ